jgi:hypothetical protein
MKDVLLDALDFLQTIIDEARQSPILRGIVVHDLINTPFFQVAYSNREHIEKMKAATAEDDDDQDELVGLEAFDEDDDDQPEFDLTPDSPITESTPFD